MVINATIDAMFTYKLSSQSEISPMKLRNQESGPRGSLVL